MTIQMIEILYFCLAVGFIVLVICIALFMQRVTKTLDKIDLILENIKDTTDDITAMRVKVKSGLLTTASTLLGLFVGKRR